MNLADSLKKENNNFDLFRLISALLVIYAHSFVLHNPSEATDVILKNFGVSSGAVAVKFFFFISGILVTNSLLIRNSSVQFIISRLFRIYPAFVFVILTSSLLIVPFLSNLPYHEYFSSIQLKSYIIENLKLNIAYYLPDLFNNNFYKGAVNGSLWTIPYEIAAYFLLLSAYIIANKKGIIIGSLLVIILPIINLDNSLFFSKSNFSISILAPCFALGCLFSIYKEKIIISLWYPIAFFILYYLSIDEYLKQLMLYFSFSTLLLYFGTIPYIQKFKLKWDISYGVYLWGFFVQQIINSLYPTIPLYYHFFASVIISIFLAIPTFYLIEKPFIKLGNKLNKLITK